MHDSDKPWFQWCHCKRLKTHGKMKNDDIETNWRQMNDVGIFSIFVFNLTFCVVQPRNNVNQASTISCCVHIFEEQEKE